MAFTLIVACSGELHELTYDRGRLHADPTHHDEELERTLVDLGAKLPKCLVFVDAADTSAPVAPEDFDNHLLWLLWEILVAGMLTDYEFDRLTIDFFRRVAPNLTQIPAFFDTIPASQLVDFMVDVAQGHDANRLGNVRNDLGHWADTMAYNSNLLLGQASEAERLGQASKADRLIAKAKHERSASFAAQCADAALWAVYRSTGNSPDVSYIEDAARFARMSKGAEASEDNWQFTLDFEERWQIRHTLEVIAAAQKDEPWPSL
jgi:hypothetical protein